MPVQPKLIDNLQAQEHDTHIKTVSSYATTTIYFPSISSGLIKCLATYFLKA